MLAQLERWMQADATYTVRYAVIELMVDFLDARFDAEHLRLVGDIHSSEYYVNMARAWYFATALAKQWESIFPMLRECILDPWTHNKTIQKACESYRVTRSTRRCCARCVCNGGKGLIRSGAAMHLRWGGAFSWHHPGICLEIPPIYRRGTCPCPRNCSSPAQIQSRIWKIH